MSGSSKDLGLSLEEIDRRIDEMPVFDLRDPKTRKKCSVDIDDIIESINLEAAMIAALKDEEP